MGRSHRRKAHSAQAREFEVCSFVHHSLDYREQPEGKRQIILKAEFAVALITTNVSLHTLESLRFTSIRYQRGHPATRLAKKKNKRPKIRDVPFCLKNELLYFSTLYPSLF